MQTFPLEHFEFRWHSESIVKIMKTISRNRKYMKCVFPLAMGTQNYLYTGFANAAGFPFIRTVGMRIEMHYSIVINETTFRAMRPRARRAIPSVQIKRFGVVHCIRTFLIIGQVPKQVFGACTTFIGV